MAGTDSKSYEKARRVARREYAAEIAAAEAGTPLPGAGSFPLSPARATKIAAKAAGLPAGGAVVGIVAAVYYEENGTRAPLAFGARKTKDGRPAPAAVASAVRKARDARGRLARWEVLGYRLAAALGSPEPVSRASLVALYEKAGGDPDASYTGRGTRAGATATRTDGAAEIVG
jgi:hypothetical protein